MANQRGETTSIGHFYNRCVDAVNNLFDTMSFWTHSKDVEFVDGKTAETKVGAINGITSDMSGEADDIAASIKCVNQLNNSLGGLSFTQDEKGNWGYKPSGADTVIPFKSGKETLETFSDYFYRSHGAGINNFSIPIFGLYTYITITEGPGDGYISVSINDMSGNNSTKNLSNGLKVSLGKNCKYITLCTENFTTGSYRYTLSN